MLLITRLNRVEAWNQNMLVQLFHLINKKYTELSEIKQLRGLNQNNTLDRHYWQYCNNKLLYLLQCYMLYSVDYVWGQPENKLYAYIQEQLEK